MTYKLITVGVLSVSLVVVLFLVSENRVHKNNAFLRRFPHHPITKKYSIDLEFNSYYVSGYDKGILYLGNTTAPLHLLKINLKTKEINSIKLNLERKDLSFKTVVVKIQPPFFYVMDGRLPCILRGNMEDWNASIWMQNEPYFSNAIPTGLNKFFIKTIRNSTKEAALGLLRKNSDISVELDSDILNKQLDGIFDVDGLMVFCENTRNTGYVYYYRNEFLVMNSNLQLLKRGRTIDTVNKVQLNLSDRNGQGIVQMQAPPVMINKSATLFNDYIFIESDRLGKYDEPEMLKQAAIIDVYNWKKDSYVMSFYLYKSRNNKLKEFKIYDNNLIAIIENQLSVYKLKPSSFESI